MLTLHFSPERETKGTWRFAEDVPEDGLSEPKVGTIYVRKSTLAQLDGDPLKNGLSVTLEATS